MIQRSFGGKISKPDSFWLPQRIEDVPEAIFGRSFLATGMGRSYGDSASVSGALQISAVALNRLISFDARSGVLVCETGVLLRDIQAIFVKLGWMLPVTPGTAWVTVGGAIANDVHGKDHHAFGTFGEHVIGLSLARSDGQVLQCSKSENQEMFHATVGGLGLTGFILKASLQLRPAAGPFFDTELLPFDSISEFFNISAQTDAEGWQAAVSWFDCSTAKAGRGAFTRGNPSTRKGETADYASALARPRISIPFTPPFSLVNKLTLDVFNSGYFALQRSKAGKSEVHYRDFYYPLDGVGNWNRIYGQKGFHQYQSVVPMEFAQAATNEMLKLIRDSRQGSFLAVLKTFANRRPAGMLSFAREGVTLAVDFPNRGARSEKIFAELDRVVESYGGALNPSKDGRMSAKIFQSGFPNLADFLNFRDPACVSDFFDRVSK